MGCGACVQTVQQTDKKMQGFTSVQNNLSRNITNGLTPDNEHSNPEQKEFQKQITIKQDVNQNLEERQIYIKIEEPKKSNNSPRIPISDDRPNGDIKQTSSMIEPEEFEDPFDSIFKDYHLKKQSSKKKIRISIINLPKDYNSTHPRRAHQNRWMQESYQPNIEVQGPYVRCHCPQIFSFEYRQKSQIYPSQRSKRHN